MKLKKGKVEYPIKDVGQIYSIGLVSDPGAYAPLRQCSRFDLAALKGSYGDARGTPIYFVHENADAGKHKLLFYPIPAEDVEAEIRFFPPMEIM